MLLTKHNPCNFCDFMQIKGFCFKTLLGEILERKINLKENEFLPLNPVWWVMILIRHSKSAEMLMYETLPLTRRSHQRCCCLLSWRRPCPRTPSSPRSRRWSGRGWRSPPPGMSAPSPATQTISILWRIFFLPSHHYCWRLERALNNIVNQCS